MIILYHCLRYRDDALARVQEQLGEEIYQAEKERTEMERVREELYLEEQEEAARQKEREEFGSNHNILNMFEVLMLCSLTRVISPQNMNLACVYSYSRFRGHSVWSN